MSAARRCPKPSKKTRKRKQPTGPPPWTSGDPYLPIAGSHGLEAFSGFTPKVLRDFTRLQFDPLPCYRPNGTAGSPGRRGAKIVVKVSEFNAWMVRRRQRQQAPPRDVGGILNQAVHEVMGRP